MIKSVTIEDVERKAIFVLHSNYMTRTLFGYCEGPWLKDKVDYIHFNNESDKQRKSIFQMNVDNEKKFFINPKITTIGEEFKEPEIIELDDLLSYYVDDIEVNGIKVSLHQVLINAYNNGVNYARHKKK